jgi:hypothetical protein
MHRMTQGDTANCMEDHTDGGTDSFSRALFMVFIDQSMAARSLLLCAAVLLQRRVLAQLADDPCTARYWKRWRQN